MQKDELYFSCVRGNNVPTDQEDLNGDVAHHDRGHDTHDNIDYDDNDGNEDEANNTEEEFDNRIYISVPYHNSSSSSSSPPEPPSPSSPKSSSSRCFDDREMARFWPQSYRQAMDIYSIIGSPNVNSSLPDLLYKPKTISCHSVSNDNLRPLISKSSVPSKEENGETNWSKVMPLKKYSSLKAIDDPHAVPSGCSLTQGVMNGVNILCGVGILSTPYALKQGGWIGLGLLFLLAIVAWYTGCLLRHCLDSKSGLSSYPDIGQAAFGITGRIIISMALYMEMYAGCVEYLILEGDNLSAIFPNASVTIGGLKFTATEVFTILTAISVLPTVWLRDLRLLAYISAGGVTATVVLVFCVFWVGTVDSVGFNQSGPLVNFSSLPISIGLFGFCFSGHSVFPNIYSSLKKPEQFSRVLTVSFIICAVMYSGVAIMGFTMFGESTESQITLNLPGKFVASKIALWSTVVNPFTKFAITMAPVAMGLEEFLPSSIYTHRGRCYSLVIRTLLVLSTLFVALSVPFFAYIMALVGSVLSMLLCLILPCACFLKIATAENKGAPSRLQIFVCVVIMVIGVICSIFGTYSSLAGIIGSWGD